MRRLLLLVTGASLVALLAACSKPATANPSDSAVATCAICHTGDRSFVGQDTAVVVAHIKSVIDGKIAHPPLGLRDESDDAIAKLAKSLTSN